MARFERLTMLRASELDPQGQRLATERLGLNQIAAPSQRSWPNLPELWPLGRCLPPSEWRPTPGPRAIAVRLRPVCPPAPAGQPTVEGHSQIRVLGPQKLPAHFNRLTQGDSASASFPFLRQDAERPFREKATLGCTSPSNFLYGGQAFSLQSLRLRQLVFHQQHIGHIIHDRDRLLTVVTLNLPAQRQRFATHGFGPTSASLITDDNGQIIERRNRFGILFSQETAVQGQPFAIERFRLRRFCHDRHRPSRPGTWPLGGRSLQLTVAAAPALPGASPRPFRICPDPGKQEAMVFRSSTSAAGSSFSSSSRPAVSSRISSSILVSCPKATAQGPRFGA